MLTQKNAAVSLNWGHRGINTIFIELKWSLSQAKQRP